MSEHNTAAGDAPVVIGYDGSAGARQAIAVAAGLFGGHRRAMVVTGWRSIAAVVPASLVALPAGIAHEAQVKMDAASLERAEGLAQEGAGLASAAGLAAEARTVEASGTVWPAVVHVADELEAAVVVVGSRGLSGIKSAFLGSTSAGVMHHSRRPVLVIRDGQPAG